MLLHERLREWARRSNHPEMLAAGDYDAAIGEYVCDMRTLFNGFADEIERCYHPKPVDRDGKPWELGDDCITAEGEEATIVGYRVGGRVFIDLHDEREFARCYASDLKRPAKVLDADGVEIKVGDTVYWTDDTSAPGHEAHVYGLGFIRDAPHSPVQVFTTKDCTLRSGWMMPKHLTHERPMLDADGVSICKGDTVWRVEDGLKMKVRAVGEEALEKYGCSVATLLPDDRCDCYGVLHYSGKELTHREPDSLEKLRDDLMAAHESWDGDPNKLIGYADRLTALIERGA